MQRRIPHLGKITLFVLLSMTDLYLTWRLLVDSRGKIYESNPVANWWLTSFGWSGLVCYKVFLVCFIVGIVLLISRFRPRSGGRFLAFACAVLTVVVLYSGSLAWAHAKGTGPFEEERNIEARRQELERQDLEIRNRLHFDYYSSRR
ncbi:MAG: DUF5658 family protein [Gemmataceae bacterium]